MKLVIIQITFIVSGAHIFLVNFAEKVKFNELNKYRIIG